MYNNNQLLNAQVTNSKKSDVGFVHTCLHKSRNSPQFGLNCLEVKVNEQWSSVSHRNLRDKGHVDENANALAVITMLFVRC